MTDLISIEDQIIKATISALLDSGHMLSVNDGEEITVNRSTNPDQIFSAMKTTDEDYLLVYTLSAGRTAVEGYVRFVYGNDDVEVINDYTVNLTFVMDKISEMIGRYEEGGL